MIRAIKEGDGLSHLLSRHLQAPIRLGAGRPRPGRARFPCRIGCIGLIELAGFGEAPPPFGRRHATGVMSKKMVFDRRGRVQKFEEDKSGFTRFGQGTTSLFLWREGVGTRRVCKWLKLRAEGHIWDGVGRWGCECPGAAEFRLLAQAATSSCARKGVGCWGGRMSGGCGSACLRRRLRGVAAPARAWGVWG